jgi:hypothetical protein
MSMSWHIDPGGVMKNALVGAVNACRAEILSGGFRNNLIRVATCCGRHLAPYSDNPHVAALLATLSNDSTACGELLELTCSVDPTLILGFFDVPYNPEAYLEAAFVTPVPIPPGVARVYPQAYGMPVLLRCCTDGLKGALSVALFGENYQGVVLQEHHRAYYFIDKFVERFKRYTRPAIEQDWSPDSFPELLQANDDMLIGVSAIWIHLHELHHRVGSLPIPKHLPEKSTRNAAGAEELRVDLLSILALDRLDCDDAMVCTAIQYILAERLIRYPLQAAPRDNYDARSSVALFSFLQRQGVISRAAGRLDFAGGQVSLRRALLGLAVKMAAVEHQVGGAPGPDIKRRLATVLPALAKNRDHWEEFAFATRGVT